MFLTISSERLIWNANEPQKLGAAYKTVTKLSSSSKWQWSVSYVMSNTHIHRKITFHAIADYLTELIMDLLRDLEQTKKLGNTEKKSKTTISLQWAEIFVFQVLPYLVYITTSRQTLRVGSGVYL